MPLIVSDWLTGTATFAMNNRQRGAFAQMLCHSWKQDASLPDNRATLAKYADEPEEWLFETAEGLAVMAQWPIGADGRRRNPKQQLVYADAKERRETKHSNAVKAARARW